MKSYIIHALFKSLDRRWQREILFSLTEWLRTWGRVIIPRAKRSRERWPAKPKVLLTTPNGVSYGGVGITDDQPKQKRKYKKRALPIIREIDKPFDEDGGPWKKDADMLWGNKNAYKPQLHALWAGQSRVFFSPISKVSVAVNYFKKKSGREFACRTIWPNTVEVTRIS